MAFAQVNINKHEGDGEPALVDPNATAIKVFYFVGEKDNTYPVANQDQAWAAAWLESGVVTEPWAPVLDLNEVKRRY